MTDYRDDFICFLLLVLSVFIILRKGRSMERGGQSPPPQLPPPLRGTAIACLWITVIDVDTVLNSCLCNLNLQEKGTRLTRIVKKHLIMKRFQEVQLSKFED